MSITEEKQSNKPANISSEDDKSASQPALFTRAFVCIALANFALFFSFQLTTVGMPVYLAQLGANEMLVGLTVTLVTAAALLIRPFSGVILDRFGRKGILIVGVVIMLVSTIAYAIFPIVVIVLVLRVFHGLGWGLGSTSTSTIVADIIPRERFAEGMGWYALGGAISSAIAPALSIFLLEQAGSSFMIFAAALALGIALIFSLLIEDSLKSSAGSSVIDESKLHNNKEASSGSAVIKKGKFDALIERDAWLPSLGMFLISVGFASVTAFIALYGMEQSVANISLYFVVYALVTILTRPIIGRLADKNGYFVPSIIGILCVLATLLIISISHEILLFCVAGVFAGIGMGTASGMFQTMAVSTVPPQRKGVATSTFLIGLDGGLCVGSAIAGVVAGVAGYAGMFAFMGIFPLVTLILFLTCYKKWSKNQNI